MRFPLITLLMVFASFLPARAQTPPLVISTNTIAHDLVQQIGGASVRAECLLPAGSDPHAFEPKPSDVRFVAQADAVVVNGLGFETWMAKLINNSGFHGTVVTLSAG